MEKTPADILDLLPEYQEKIQALCCELLLSNLVMLSEIPAPTFHEQRRKEYMLSRFSEHQLLNCSTDELGNALALLPGTKGDRTILVVAHMDTVFPEGTDHSVTIQPNAAIGAGVGDNGLGIAVITILPLLFEQLELAFESNIVLMGSTRSLGRGNIEGIRFFLSNTNLPITSGICVEGVELGRLSYSTLGLLRAELTYRVPDEYDWTRFGAGGAIINLNEAINRILEIPLPRRPRTSIVLGSVEGGNSFDSIATQALLRFEIRSESGETVEELGRTISDLAEEISSQTGSEVKFDILARRDPGGIGYSHPIARISREVMERLGIEPRITPGTGDLSAFIDRKIPAVTVGITHGEHYGKQNEMIHIDPIPRGVAQLIGILLAMDRGYGNGY
jgi:tripeptide aminopeptidase